MFNIFKAVGNKFMGDLKEKAIKMGKDLSEEILAMAKTQDLDSNGVKDHLQVLADLSEVVTHCKAGVEEFKKCIPLGQDVVKLAGLYYLKFGPQRPTVVVAALEQESNVA